MEKLRKVNSFSELKVGHIVVDIGCTMCTKPKCRSILIRKAIFGPTGNEFVAFLVEPNCNDGVGVIVEMAVVQGRIYLVEDGLEDMEKVGNEKKLVKAL